VVVRAERRREAGQRALRSGSGGAVDEQHQALPGAVAGQLAVRRAADVGEAGRVGRRHVEKPARKLLAEDIPDRAVERGVGQRPGQHQRLGVGDELAAHVLVEPGLH